MSSIFDDPTIADKLRLIVERIYDKLDGTTGVLRDIDSEFKKVQSDADRAFDGLLTDMNQAITLQTTFFQRARAELKQFGREFEDSEAGRWLAGKSGTAGGLSGRPQGFQAIGQNVRQLQSEIFGSLPFGGVIGLILAGMKYDGEARAAGMQAVSIFRMVGREASAEAEGVGKYIRDLETTVPDIASRTQAAFAAMASAGIKPADAFDKATTAVGGFGDKVYQATLGLDSMYQQGGGTAARIAGELVGNTGGTFKAMVEDVRELGEASESSGLSFAMFTGQIVQATSALRTQQVTQGDLVKSFSLVRGAAQAAYKGANETFQDLRAGEAFQTVVRGLGGGYSEGLRAVLGQRMAAAQSQDISAEQGYVEMVRGFSSGTKSSDFVERAFTEISKLVDEVGGDGEFSRMMTVKKLLGGDDNAALILSEALKEGTFGKLPAEMQKAFRDALDAEANKKSPLEKLLDDLKRVVPKFADLLVTTLAGLARISYEGFRALLVGFSKGTVSDPLAGFRMGAKDIETTFDNIGATMTRKYDSLEKALKDISGDSARILRQLWPSLKRAEDEPTSTPLPSPESILDGESIFRRPAAVPTSTVPAVPTTTTTTSTSTHAALFKVQGADGREYTLASQPVLMLVGQSVLT